MTFALEFFTTKNTKGTKLTTLGDFIYEIREKGAGEMA